LTWNRPPWFNFQVQTASPPVKEPVKEYPRVLHIDHPPAILRLMERSFQGRPLTWDCAESGAQGLHMALIQSYHLIILGFKETGIDGARVVHGLKRAGITTPILLLMPSKELERRREELARLPNVLGCLAKPVDLRQVDRMMDFLRHPPTLKAEDKARLLEVLERIEKAIRDPG
jgi:CheY-like chemotaxis protein